MRQIALVFSLALVFATQAAAQERMSIDLCNRGWAAFSEALGSNEVPPRIHHEISPFGWCRANNGQVRLDRLEFTELRWRSRGLQAALDQGVPPRALWAELEGVDIVKSFDLNPAPGGRPRPGRIKLAAAQRPDARELDIEHLTLDLGNQGRVTLVASVGQVDLSSPVNMQLSLGTARVNQVTVNVNSMGLVGKLIWPSVMKNQPVGKGDAQVLNLFRTQLGAVLNAMPPGVLEAHDRAAIAALVRALPDVRGQVRLTLASDTGFGLAQLWLSARVLDGLEDKLDEPEALRAALAQVFRGVEMDVAWTPGG